MGAAKKPQCMPLGVAVQRGIIANETLGYFIGRTHLFLKRVGLTTEVCHCHHRCSVFPERRMRQAVSALRSKLLFRCWPWKALHSVGSLQEDPFFHFLVFTVIMTAKFWKSGQKYCQSGNGRTQLAAVHAAVQPYFVCWRMF